MVGEVIDLVSWILEVIWAGMVVWTRPIVEQGLQCFLVFLEKHMGVAKGVDIITKSFPYGF